MRNDFALNLTTPVGPRTVTLSLDAAQMSQRIMIEEFGQGRLYESETSNFIGSILAPGDAFIDVGGHVGYFSMLASALVGEQGRVYTFEPERSNYEHLLDHIAINNAVNVTPFHMAVGATSAIAEFFVNADNDGGHALWEVGRHPFNERTRQAPTTRKTFVTSLDQLFGDRDMSVLKAIKIDAEGSEFAVLAGARRLLARHPVPFVIAEVNRFALQAMGVTEGHVRDLMGSLGYETYLFQPGQTFVQRLSADQTPDTNYVFNLLFRHPMAPALAA
jgi:FkbM family methyltransferase